MMGRTVEYTTTFLHFDWLCFVYDGIIIYLSFTSTFKIFRLKLSLLTAIQFFYC